MVYESTFISNLGSGDRRRVRLVRDPGGSRRKKTQVPRRQLLPWRRRLGWRRLGVLSAAPSELLPTGLSIGPLPPAPGLLPADFFDWLCVWRPRLLPIRPGSHRSLWEGKAPERNARAPFEDYAGEKSTPGVHLRAFQPEAVRENAGPWLPGKSSRLAV
jgi:hypothetical protein